MVLFSRCYVSLPEGNGDGISMVIKTAEKWFEIGLMWETQ